jgi:hypothetical protein
VLQNNGLTVPINISLNFNVSTNFVNITDVDPLDPYTFGYSYIGFIGTPHGIKGEIKVCGFPGSDDIIRSSLGNLTSIKDGIVYVKRPNRKTPRPLKISTLRKMNDQKNTYILKLDGIANREDAAYFSKYKVYVSNYRGNRTGSSGDRNEANRTKRENNIVKKTTVTNEYNSKDIMNIKCYKYDSNDVEEINSYNPTITTTTDVDYMGKVVDIITPYQLCKNRDNVPYMHSILVIERFNMNTSNIERYMLPMVIPEIVYHIHIDDDYKESSYMLITPPIGLIESTTYIHKPKYHIRGYLSSRSISLLSSSRSTSNNNSNSSNTDSISSRSFSHSISTY